MSNVYVIVRPSLVNHYLSRLNRSCGMNQPNNLIFKAGLSPNTCFFSEEKTAKAWVIKLGIQANTVVQIEMCDEMPEGLGADEVYEAWESNYIS